MMSANIFTKDFQELLLSSFSILFPILFSSLSVIETEIDFSDSCHENDTWIMDIEKKLEARVQVPNQV